jgi:hypothetical protein
MTSEFLEQLGDEIAAGRIVRIASDPWFELIESNFPVGLNRIMWDRVKLKQVIDVLPSPRTISSDELRALISDRLSEVKDWLARARVSPTQSLIWIGDDSADGLRMDVPALLEHLPYLMSFPQHSYVLPENGAWCLNYVMEGQLVFGFSAKRDLA